MESPDNKGFWKSLQDRYKDPPTEAEINRTTSRICGAYFWCSAITQLYIMIGFVVPHQFVSFGSAFQLVLKLGCWFVFVQSAMNWAFVKYVDSFFKRTKDSSYPFKKRDAAERNSYKHNNLQRNHDTETEKRCKSSTGNGFEDNSTNKHDVQIDIENNSSTETAQANGYDPSCWRWCESCQHQSPPRSHHCKICNACILKRDHHCHMLGVCIGHYNQRYFVILNAYTALANTIGLYLVTVQLRETFADSGYGDYVLPVTLYRWLVGSTVELHQLLMVSMIYTMCWSGFAAAAYTIWQLTIIANGQTTYELRKEISIQATSSVGANFRSVFGPYWPLNFVFPTQLLFRQGDDGTQWNVKIV